jgi:signal transduction histidine kinase
MPPATKQRETPDEGGRPLILIVDDNHDNINVIEEMLEPHGFDYFALSDPTQILDAMGYRTPDLVLLDLYMPRQSGLETLRGLKKDARFESTPVIMLTAESDKEMLSLCLDAGAMDYLNKPVDPVELRARIRSALKIATLNRMLSRQNEELDRKNRELQRFTGTIVHDLKSPLTVITASIDVVRQALLDAGKARAVEMADLIKKVAFSMNDSVNELLDVSRIQLGVIDLNIVRADPVALIDDCLERMRVLAERKSIRLVHERTNVPPVSFDEKLVRTIVMNLIGNAVKYSPPDTEVRLTYEIDDRNVQVVVTDQGQGLTEKDRGLVFREFGRLSARPTAGESSTGLGLAIVKSAAEAMGSTVGVNSEGKGKGASFWFTLPRPGLSDKGEPLC